MFLRFVLFALLLLPAFLRIGWWYFWSTNIKRSLPYGEGKLRQKLDVYLPTHTGTAKQDHKGSYPVLFFTGGGAWVVGHKVFCALLGRIFMGEGVLVVAPDYRQFPQVRVDEMLSDVDRAIQWTFDHCHEYGGDPERIYIAGQSAGAHLTSTLVLEHASSEIKARAKLGKQAKHHLGRIVEDEEDENMDETENKMKTENENNEHDKVGVHPKRTSTSSPPTRSKLQSTTSAASVVQQDREGGSRGLILLPWKCSKIAGYVGISGPYQLVHLREHLFERGIEQVSFLTHLIGGEKTSLMTDTQRDVALAKHSPAIRMRSRTFQGIGEPGTQSASVFPPFVLIHGESDNVVPTRSTKEFAKSLRSAGIDVTVKYLKGASHTDPIIEDLLFDESGGKDAGAITELLRLIRSGDGSNCTQNKRVKKLRRPSMLAAGFGYVTDERGRLPENTLCGWIPRMVIRAARAVNPF